MAIECNHGQVTLIGVKLTLVHPEMKHDDFGHWQGLNMGLARHADVKVCQLQATQHLLSLLRDDFACKQGQMVLWLQHTLDVVAEGSQ